jgi:hypothetical protein
MSAIVIESSNPKNLKLLVALAEQLGESVKKLSQAQYEDIQLSLFIKSEKTGKEVSREDVFKLLDAK